MAFADTYQAIEAITQLLSDQLQKETGLQVYAGRLENTLAQSGINKYNLFLYEVGFDASLKNVSLDERMTPPLWLVLKFLVTAVDDTNETDTPVALRHLGKALAALQDLSFLRLAQTEPDWVKNALKDNPEELKITFDEITIDLLSKLVQGSDAKYRLAMGFQVRPVMVVSQSQLPAFSLLVGVDYTQTPAQVIAAKDAVTIDVLAGLGPQLLRVSPEALEPQEDLTLWGLDLNLTNAFPTLAGKPLALKDPLKTAEACLVCSPQALITAEKLSAGQYPVAVVQNLDHGRKRSSQQVFARLLPRLDSTPVFTPLTDPDYGSLALTGELLGGAGDDILLALYRDGQVKKIFQNFTTTSDQKSLLLTLQKLDAPLPGTYRLILRVNGQQARISPEVVLP
jgi:hypothetical protein